MANKLQLLRNETITNSHKEAFDALSNQLAISSVGEPVVNIFIEDEKEHILFGIKGKDGYQIFEGSTFDEEGNIIIPDYIQDAIDEIKKETVTSITKEGDTIKIEDADATDKELKLNYASSMPDDLTTPNAIGGIDEGITAETLKSKTYGEIIDMILFPELNPTITEPSSTIAFKNGFTNNGIFEVGANAPINPTNFTTTFNRGKGVVAGKNDIERAGALDTTNSFIYYNKNTENKILPEKVVLGDMKYTYRAVYSEGNELVTSYGNKATKDSQGNVITANPLEAGNVDSEDIQIFGTYPYFCNGTNADKATQESSLPTTVTPDTKLTLIKWTDSTIAAKFASEAATGARFIFDFPATKKINKVEFMNTVSGKWESFTSYVVNATDAKTIQGVSVNYKRLTTVGDLAGALQLRFTVANA